MISTHPDQDHINGLTTIMDELSVGELLIHRPHDHTARSIDEFGNIEVVDALIALAEESGVTVTEPFAGLTRFGGQIRVLGPTLARYEDMLNQHLDEVESGTAATRVSKASFSASLASKAVDWLDRTISYLPIETLQEGGETGPRNNMSVVTLLSSSGERVLLTGDAGIDALNEAIDEYEARVAAVPDVQMSVFQAPHHGSKHNLAP